MRSTTHPPVPHSAPPRGGSDLPKSLSGVKGLDEITFGGLPTGRPTLICGSAGSGKTFLAMEFIVQGAMHFGEPGVFMSFESSGSSRPARDVPRCRLATPSCLISALSLPPTFLGRQPQDRLR